MLLVPIALLSLGPYFALWGVPSQPFPADIGAALFFLTAFVLGTLLHEGLHGLGHVVGRASWNDIRFGIHWKAVTPFARCTVPSRTRGYRLAVALPGLVLGLLPLGVGLWSGHWLTTFYGFLMLVAAAGDLVVLWILRGVPSDAWVQDHPEKVGCLVVADAEAPAPAPMSADELPLEDAQNRDEFSLLQIGLLLMFSLACSSVGFLIALA
ncbi:MAG: metalloprotease family protein [Salinivenus sp.]